jgi:spore coat protein U-like protein
MIHKSIRKFLVVICSLTIFLCASNTHAADKCSFSIVAGVDFGSYNVFQETANDFGVGTIDVSCDKKNKKFTVSLSTGQSNTFTNRVMNSGTNLLQYNLFTSAARNVVWGDGTGGSQNIFVNDKNTYQLDIFGLINPLQDVSVGYYSDFITVSIEF